MKPTALATLGALTLAACQTGASDLPEASPLPEGAADTCGAAGFAHTIGTDHGAHDFASPDRPLRIIPPNSAITMDYSENRLNVDLDDAGRVVRLWCG